jgi:hypothetical protein
VSDEIGDIDGLDQSPNDEELAEMLDEAESFLLVEGKPNL